MSWLFSQALVAEYSHLISWDGEQCAQLNVMPTPHKFWRNDRMMEFSKLSQFGLTLQLLTENHGKELLTLYLAAFRAKTSHPRGKVLESKVNVLGFGQKWHELLVKYDLDTCSWKTHQCLFPEDLHESSVTLPKWGMTRNGHVFQHLTLERPISVTESGLLPTPDASEGKRGPAKHYDPKAKSQSGRTLTTWVATFPTPKASDGNKRGKVSNHPRNGLAGVVENLPTPTASMSKGSSPATLTRKDGKSGGKRSARSSCNEFTWWQVEPELGRVADGVAHRVDRLKAIGNGQVSIVAKCAFEYLGGAK